MAHSSNQGGSRMSLKKSLFAASAAALMAGGAYAADSLTIAIVNNGHMINMQKVAEAYTAETGVALNWVALEEGVLREQVTLTQPQAAVSMTSSTSVCRKHQSGVRQAGLSH